MRKYAALAAAALMLAGLTSCSSQAEAPATAQDTPASQGGDTTPAVREPTQAQRNAFLNAIDAAIPSDIPRNAETGEMFVEQGLGLCFFAEASNLPVRDVADQVGSAPQSQEELAYAGLNAIVAENAAKHFCPDLYE